MTRSVLFKLLSEKCNLEIQGTQSTFRNKDTDYVVSVEALRTLHQSVPYMIRLL